MHTKLCPKKKLLGKDKLEYFHVHGRIILKVKDEALPGLRHEGIYERLTSRPGRSTPRTNPPAFIKQETGQAPEPVWTF
jgi:hypothetical protein